MTDKTISEEDLRRTIDMASDPSRALCWDYRVDAARYAEEILRLRAERDGWNKAASYWHTEHSELRKDSRLLRADLAEAHKKARALERLEAIQDGYAITGQADEASSFRVFSFLAITDSGNRIQGSGPTLAAAINAALDKEEEEK